MARKFTDTEMEVALKAIDAYNWQINRINKVKEYLKDKKFHFGDYIIKKGTNILDGLFGCGNGKIGKIVGYDNEYNYYRVFYSKDNSYVGVREEDMKAFEGEVPEDVKNYDPYDIKTIMVHLDK